MLTIEKGGLLLKTEWKYDSEKENGEYITFRPKNPSFCYLMEECELADDIILKDILLLLNKELDFYSVLLGNWVDEIVAEGLKPPTESVFEIDYLELYWLLNKCTDEGIRSLDGHFFPALRGWGNYDNSGEKGGIAIGTLPVNSLAYLPLKLKKEAIIYHENLDAEWTTIEELKKQQDDPVVIDKCPYSLLHILYGIVWELSFFGPPEVRNNKVKDLKELADKVTWKEVK